MTKHDSVSTFHDNASAFYDIVTTRYDNASMLSDIVSVKQDDVSTFYDNAPTLLFDVVIQQVETKFVGSYYADCRAVWRQMSR